MPEALSFSTLAWVLSCVATTVALAGFLVAVAARREEARTARMDAAIEHRIAFHQDAMEKDLQGLRGLIAHNWEKQIEAQNAVLKQHAVSMEHNADIIERLLLQNSTGLLTAETVRKEHEEALKMLRDRIRLLTPAADILADKARDNERETLC
jgi:uncharacterized protein (DUF1697 family)